MLFRRRAPLGLLALLLPLAGCTSVQRTFDDHEPEEVWRAMVTVAERPLYERWQTAANDVWADEQQQRLEVFRRLRRVERRPGAPPHREERTWRFEIRLVQPDPPVVKFTSRGLAVPALARREALRYLADVEDVLRVGSEP